MLTIFVVDQYLRPPRAEWIKVRLLSRLSVIIGVLGSWALVSPSPSAYAVSASQSLQQRVCETLNISPCSADAVDVDVTPTVRRVLPNGCWSDYASLHPGLHYVYDPTLGFSYPVLYMGVAVQVYCPKAAQLTAVAESVPTALTSEKSHTYAVGNCPDSTYCEATAVWAHNWLLEEPVCAYTSAEGAAGAYADVPYFPSWTTAGAFCT